MDVTASHATRHSEKEFTEQLLMLIDSGAGVIHVRTNEVLRATSCIRRAVLLDKSNYREWDIVNGVRQFTIDDCNDEAAAGDNNSDISAAFAEPLGVLRDGGSEKAQVFCYVNPQVFMENNPHMSQLLLMYNEFLPACRTCVVLVTPDAPLPESAATSSILSLRFHPPGLQELRDSLTTLLKDAADTFPKKRTIAAEELDKICFAGAGMTRLQFETYVSLGNVREERNDAPSINPEALAAEVQIGKTDIVNSSDVLELYPKTSIDDVGGMENLKEWINRRKACYSDEARESGVEPPKGLVLVGVPGSGKSLVAKAIAGVLGVPLLRLDFGRVFSSFVGSSEQRVRSALRMVESMAPCVLMCVAGSTKVSLADGSTETIERMYEEQEARGASYTLRGMCPSSGQLIDLPMRTIIRTQGKPMLRITSASGRSIEVTTDHRLLVLRKGERVWVEAQNLSVGDDLVEI